MEGLYFLALLWLGAAWWLILANELWVKVTHVMSGHLIAVWGPLQSSFLLLWWLAVLELMSAPLSWVRSHGAEPQSTRDVQVAQVRNQLCCVQLLPRRDCLSQYPDWHKGSAWPKLAQLILYPLHLVLGRSGVEWGQGSWERTHLQGTRHRGWNRCWSGNPIHRPVYSERNSSVCVRIIKASY